MTAPGPYEAVIGLEVHAQLLTRSKLFSGSATGSGAPPNTHVDPVCLGLPGVLPVLNRAAVDAALRLALATGCAVRRRTRFARKHYFYPDLPKGYQITQYEEPLAEHGRLDIEVAGAARRVRLRRLHLEEDAGKSVHRAHTSLVDFNRAGVPLVEIVTEPDLRTADEAAAVMRTLRQLVRWLGIGDGNMEDGSLRCDVNVSLRPSGSEAYGTKTELKNLNSFKFVRDAIAHEIARQEAVLRDGGRVAAETRLWDAARGRSATMRAKEEAHDYRYFPEPDLPPLVIDDAWLDAARAALPELPAARRARFVADYGIAAADAALLTAERDLSDYFEAAARAHGDGRTVAHWVANEVLRELRRTGAAAAAAPVGPAALAGLCDLVRDQTLSGPVAKEVFAAMVATGRPARDVVRDLGLARLGDPAALEAACRTAVDGNPQLVAQYRAGKTKLLGFFVGEVMKATRGQAAPEVVNDILRRLLILHPSRPE
jgi:aspartyl-tRNA(Asn)/glutamyl-tRNA(Gln) amidotransferase subunit B